MTKHPPTTTALAIFGIFVGLFPWLFAYQGVLFGQKISVRAMGDFLGFMMVGLGLFLFFSKKGQQRILQYAEELDQLSPSHQNRVMWMGVGIYLVGVLSHKLRAQYNISTHAFDLGFFSNICWNTAHGNWFFCSELERNFMAVHVNWILWPLSFFYRFFPGATVLLVAQAVILVATVPIFWKLTQQITGKFSAGALVSLLFLSSPYINHVISNDFHPDVWQVPCLMAALWAWKNQRHGWILIFSLLALLAKEDVSVVLCGFGIFLMLQPKMRATGLILFLLSLGAFIFHVHFFTPRFVDGGGNSLLFSRYPLLGNNVQEILHTLILNPLRLAEALVYDPSKYGRLACYLLPMGGLSLLSPLLLIPPFISVLPHLLSQASTQLSLADIYSLPAQAFLFVGAVIGAQRMVTRYGEGLLPRLIAVLFVVAGFGIYNSPRYFRSQNPIRIAAFSELRSLVPDDASVAAQQNLQPHFDCRRYIQLFPLGNSMVSLQHRNLENPEYVVADRIGNALPYDGVHLKVAIQSLEENPSYEKIFERENFLLFKRRSEEPLRWKVFTN